MGRVRLPNGWQPRPYQLPLWRYLEGGGKRAVAVWHRRAGKDDLCLHWTACAALQRVGNYWHMLPEAAQARKAIWDAINPHTGKRRIDEAFPREIRKRTVDNEMKIEFANGSIWQVVGSDNYDSLVGSPPVGVVFSEWALADPAAWSFMRPVLLENGGWALFIFTPRGRNHAATFFDGARRDPAWFTETLKANETGVFTQAQLDQELAEYVRETDQETGESRFRQEYLCDFNAAVVGSFYGRLMTSADAEKRICRVPWDPKLPVQTAWDIGVTDSTAIWFYQVAGREVWLIDYLESSGVGAEWYAKELRAKPYTYGDCTWPHDVGNKQFTTGDTIEKTLRSLGFKGAILANESVEDGIQAARNLLPRCWFDAEKCARGIDALRQYRRKWDDKLKAFQASPLHDWTSHGADAYRYLAKGLKVPSKPKPAGERNHGPGGWLG